MGTPGNAADQQRQETHSIWRFQVFRGQYDYAVPGYREYILSELSGKWDMRLSLDSDIKPHDAPDSATMYHR